MRDFRDSKTMAKALRRGLAGQSVDITHSQSLELIAQAFGFDDWNILAAKIEAAKPAEAEAKGPDDPILHCGFCGKPQTEVKMLIAAPSSFICDACVRICDGVIEDNELLRHLKGETADETAFRAHLDGLADAALAAYLERAKTAAETERTTLRMLDERPANVPANLGDTPPAQRERQRRTLQRQLAARAHSIEIVTEVLAARG